MLTIDLAKALIAWVRSAFAKISNILIWTEYFYYINHSISSYWWFQAQMK